MSDNSCKKCGSLWVIASAILAIGIAAAGWMISSTLYKARMASNTVTVKGLAERETDANLAIWTLSFSNSGATLAQVQQKSLADQQAISQFLVSQGFQPQDIITGALRVRDLMSDAYNQGRIAENLRYVAEGDVTLRTSQVNEVEKARLLTTQLIDQNVLLTMTNNGPNYKFIGLDEVKPQMLAQATKDARNAAQQFAKDSEVDVLGIANAQQGYFSITGADGFEEMGETSVKKKIRVVTTVTFYLGE